MNQSINQSMDITNSWVYKEQTLHSSEFVIWGCLIKQMFEFTDNQMMTSLFGSKAFDIPIS
jgi:hypothetical protein